MSPSMIEACGVMCTALCSGGSPNGSGTFSENAAICTPDCAGAYWGLFAVSVFLSYDTPHPSRYHALAGPVQRFTAFPSAAEAQTIHYLVTIKWRLITGESTTLRGGLFLFGSLDALDPDPFLLRYYLLMLPTPPWSPSEKSIQ